MNNYFKNLLAGLSVFTQVSILVVLLLFHGVTAETDSLFLAITISAVLQLIALMPYDQFIVFYNRADAQSENASKTFYFKVLILSVFFGLFLTLMSGCMAWFLYQFTSSAEIKGFLDKNVINGFLLGLLGYSLLGLNDRFYNARGKIVTSYLVLLIPQIAVLIGVLFWTFIEGIGVEAVGYVYAFFVWLGAVFTTAFILQNIDCNFKNIFSGTRMFIVNSVMMRLGHNIYAISFQLVTNLFLLGMAEGMISMFNYAYKAVVAVFSITVSPANRVFMYELSILAAKKSLVDRQVTTRKYIRDSVPLYALFILSAILLITLIVVTEPGVVKEIITIDLKTLLSMFTYIAFWQFIIIVESVYVGLIISLSKYQVFIIVNSIFASLYIFTGYMLKDLGEIYLLIFAGMFSQLISLFLYRYILIKMIQI